MIEDSLSFYTGGGGAIYTEGNFAIMIYMEVDNSQCVVNCYKKSGALANYMAAALCTELREDWSVVQIGETNNLNPKDSKSPIRIIIRIKIIAFVTVSNKRMVPE